MKKILSCFVVILCIVGLLSGCSNSNVRVENETYLSEDQAKTELKSLTKSLKPKEITNPTLDIYEDDTVKISDSLADIDTFPIMEEGKGKINIEVAAATEMSASAPDDWLNLVAKNFNKEEFEVNEKPVSVSIRKITSGEVVTYILNSDYKPELYIPSNEAWGKMLEASGIGIDKIEDRIAGNTAGILIKKDVYDKFLDKYKEVFKYWVKYSYSNVKGF